MADHTPLIPCPFCGGLPTITKHFRDDVYRLIHRCPVVGAISFDWMSDPQLHADRWNTRRRDDLLTELRAFVAEKLPAINGDGSKTRDAQRSLVSAFVDYFAVEQRAKVLVDTDTLTGETR